MLVSAMSFCEEPDAGKLRQQALVLRNHGQNRQLCRAFTKRNSRQRDEQDIKEPWAKRPNCFMEPAKKKLLTPKKLKPNTSATSSKFLGVNHSTGIRRQTRISGVIMMMPAHHPFPPMGPSSGNKCLR